jgi:hypothetical protein
MHLSTTAFTAYFCSTIQKANMNFMKALKPNNLMHLSTTAFTGYFCSTIKKANMSFNIFKIAYSLLIVLFYELGITRVASIVSKTLAYAKKIADY